MHRPSPAPSRLLALLASLLIATPLAAQEPAPCRAWRPEELRENPGEAELRCRYGADGPGRFGLLSYLDLPVYQPVTPMPGTHVIGVPGHAAPAAGESYEAWEWRILRARIGPEGHEVHRAVELLAGDVAPRVRLLEDQLRQAGIAARRRESWRSPTRQAYLFQQGRSRPGPLATATLTSLHSEVDSLGRPAGRAVDYEVPPGQLHRFHELVREAGLRSYGPESYDNGHVFLPSTAVPEAELMLLRLLPRVTEVTLSTGAPSDVPLDAAGRAALREAEHRFATEPFLPHPRAGLARALPSGRVITTPAAPALAAAECALGATGSRRSRAGGGGAPCAPRRSAAPSEGGSPRSMDG